MSPRSPFGISNQQKLIDQQKQKDSYYHRYKDAQQAMMRAPQKQKS